MLFQVRRSATLGLVVVGMFFWAGSILGKDAEFKTGDRVVTVDKTPVQATEGTVATLDAGTELSVIAVKEDWIGVSGNQGEKKITGWVKPAVLAPSTSSAPSGAKQAFQTGYAHHLKGQFEPAIASYSEAIRIDPAYTDAYNNRGLAYQSARRLQDAINDFSKVIELSPTASRGYLNRGFAYAGSRNFDQALADYTEALRIDPENYQAYKRRAAVYEAKGDKQHAAVDHAVAAKYYQTKYNTVAHKGIALELELKANDYKPNLELLDAIIDEAKAKIKVKKTYTLESAIAVLQTIDSILVRRRFLTIDQGLLCDSLTSRQFTKQMLQSPNSQAMRFRPNPGEEIFFAHPLAICAIYAAIGEELKLPIHLAISPNQQYYVRWDIADVGHVNWDPTVGTVKTDDEFIVRGQASIAALQNGVYLSPLSHDAVLACILTNIARAWVGEWYGLDNDLSPAKILEKSKGAGGNASKDLGAEIKKTPKPSAEKEKKEPAQPTPEEQKLLEINTRERVGKAMDALDKALEFNPKAYNTYLLRAGYFTRMADYEKAISDNSTAIELNPDDAAPYFGRAHANLSRGNFSEALGDFDKVIQLKPELPSAFYFRGIALAETKQFDRAVEDLSRAIRMEPRLVNAYEIRAKIYEMLGQQDKANEDRKKILMLQKK